jgi:hypothetical protein
MLLIVMEVRDHKGTVLCVLICLRASVWKQTVDDKRSDNTVNMLLYDVAAVPKCTSMKCLKSESDVPRRGNGKLGFGQDTPVLRRSAHDHAMPVDDRSIVFHAVDHVDDDPIVLINDNWWTCEAAANLHDSALGRSGTRILRTLSVVTININVRATLP